MRRSTLEALFTQAEQSRAFLLMLVCGVLLAALIAAIGLLHRVSRAAGLAADALCTALTTAALGQVVLWTGGLRLYALLGLCIGGVLATVGMAPCLRFLRRRLQKSFSARQE